MFKANKNLLIIAMIAVVNALGYGIIIPVLYSYSQKFGLSDFDNGLLFSLFSVCQLLSTPIIGRLSDKYGRKPLLVLSLAGTALSFFLMAWAPSAAFLFLARALDGITAGNIPVASAVISDSTEPKDRAKGFGIIGASFGFGFVFGPAISALTVGYGDWVPFLIAGTAAAIAVVLTAIFLPETNKHKKEVAKAPLFDVKKLVFAIADKQIGTTLMITLLFSLAFSLFIYAYQPFSVKILGLSATAISINFTIFGVVQLLVQTVLMPQFLKRTEERKLLFRVLVMAIFTFAMFFFIRDNATFMIVSIFHAMSNAFANPLLQALLSKEVDAASQGSIMGISASYMSIGMIIGPIVGGLLATISIPLPFLLGSALAALCAVYAYGIMKRPIVVKREFS